MQAETHSFNLVMLQHLSAHCLCRRAAASPGTASNVSEVLLVGVGVVGAVVARGGHESASVGGHVLDSAAAAAGRAVQLTVEPGEAD